MAEICIEVSNELKREMEKSRVDISLLIKRLIKHLEEEREMIDWSVKLQRSARRGRHNKLKKGLI